MESAIDEALSKLNQKQSEDTTETGTTSETSQDTGTQATEGQSDTAQ